MFTADTLTKKLVLITGGGSGLGLAMAKRFSSLGASIAICGRDQDKLGKAIVEIQSHSTNSTAKFNSYRCDVREYDAVATMISTIKAEMGLPTSLINNAAGNFLCASEDLSSGAFKTIIDIVLTGTFNCTQHFGKLLIENGAPGEIVNIVTTYTETGSAFVLPSACAKAGVYALTTSLAYEWGTYGIRLNAIAPGPIPTEGAWQRLVPDRSLEDVFKKRIPSGRFGTQEELANLAAFLLSDLAPYINGECISIDGGERLCGGEFNFITQLMDRPQLRKTFSKMKR